MAPRPPAAVDELSLADHVCLALVTQGVSHGWAIGSVLSPDGEIGRIWHLSRPLTYRSLDGLVACRLATRKGQAAGRGRERVLLAPTAAGRRAAAAWLDAPVAHLRDVRTELLVKLALRERAGLDRAPLLVEQQAVFAPAIDALTTGSTTNDPVDVWRRESARAVRRFLDQAARPTAPMAPPPELRLSARNQLRAEVRAVHFGEVMATVHATLADGQSLTAAITKDAAEGLDLAAGDEVVLIVKSTEVMVAKLG